MSSISAYQEFAESLRARHREIRRTAHEMPPAGVQESLREAASLLESTLAELEAAAEELAQQNDALFEARVETEAQGQFYRELFDLAPAACLVTTADARITHANLAATYLFGRAANALVGRPLVSFVELGERSAFRLALSHALAATSVSEWPLRLLCRGAAPVECRLRVSVRREAKQVHALQWIITEDGAADDDLL